MEYGRLKELGEQSHLVISDMDGTLLNSKKQITERTRKAIRRLEEKNKRFTICTGRIPSMAEYYIRELDICTPVVAANGAVVWDPVERKILYEQPIPASTAQKLMDFFQYYRMDYSALLLEASYFSPDSVRIQKFETYNQIAKAGGGQTMKLICLKDGHRFLQEQNIDKILVYETDKQRYQMAGDFMAEFPDICATSSDDGLWDISSAGISKGTGLLAVAQRLELPGEAVCAFGDYYNDIPMLTCAGFPIAMGNGCKELKEAAVYVTGTNDEDGVAEAIEKFLL